MLKYQIMATLSNMEMTQDELEQDRIAQSTGQYFPIRL